MFFDRKEDVIDLELTQYGKYLLSKGKMKPAYYAFYDDDILYDSDYTGISEEQNSTEDRIRLETPRPKTQYVYSGIETEVKRINELVRSKISSQRVDLGAESIQPSNDKHHALVSPIGTSDLNIDKAAAWFVKFYKGEVIQSKNYTHITGSNSKSNMDRIINFPQVDCQAVYETSINLETIDTHALAAGMLTVDDLDFNIPSAVSNEAGLISVEEDFLLINIEEKNTQFLLKNFDIELFEVEEAKDTVNTKHIKTGDENLIPLNFLINQGYDSRDRDSLSLASNRMLEEQELELIAPEVTPRDVEYYFDIFVDDEIATEILCEHVEDRSKGIFADEFIDCNDLKEKVLVLEDIYQVDPSDVEGSGEIC
jgi:hypothetical protein